MAEELERDGIDLENDSYAQANAKIREAQRAAGEMRNAAREDNEYRALDENSQEQYAIMRENGASHDEAMAVLRPSEDLPLFQFAGENAQTAALDSLRLAQNMEINDYSTDEIWRETGWYKGKDGKWRFEISDKDATINRQVLKDIGSIENLRAERDQLLDDIEAFKKEREKNNDAYPDGYLDELISQRYDKIEKIDYDIDHGYVSSAKTTLGELLDHEKLYAAYPSLRYMPVTIRTSDDLSGGAYSRKDNTIYLDSRLSDDEIKSILMHEIQHVIQEKENFSRGGNIQFAKDYKKIIEKKASAEFMDLLDKKMKEGLERELKEYNLNKEAIVEILDAYSDYTKKFFDTDAENEEVNKAEKKYYETLEKYNISSDILENAMNNLRDQGIWKEAENEVKSKNKLSDADAYEIYRAFFGEVEARNTQARMDLTEEERRAKTPESTQDIKNADALIVMPDGTAMAYDPKASENIYWQEATEESIKNISNEIDDLIKVVNEGKNRSETRKIGNVSEKLNRLAQENANIDLSGYIHNIDTSSIIHIKNNHGDAKREEKRGQIAVTPEDLKKIPQIIYNWDYIAFGGKNKRKQDVIIYGKNMPDGSSVYVEEIRTGRKTLTTNTIRKYKTGVNSNTFTSRVGEDVQNDTSHIKIISKNKENVNREKVLYQSAFAGSGVDYDRPALEAIGSGEGAQVHGWGLYYALDREVAEGYRERSYASREGQREHSLNADFETLTVNGKPLLDVYNIDMDRSLYNDLLYKPYGTVEAEIEDRIAGWEDRANDPDYSFKDYAKEKIDAYKRLKEDLFNNGMSLIKKDYGQVHEVDIPENPYLLDEQLPFGAQPEFVKTALKSMVEKENLKYEVLKNLENNYSGRQIYNALSSELGSPKAASQMLEKYGIKGIAYDGSQDGRCFVIFNPDDVKVIQKFYQGNQSPTGRGGVARGAYSNNIIYLFEHADASTVIHELGHYFLDDLQKYGKSEKSQQQLQAIYNYLGAKDGVITTEMHEYFADSFEVYLKEGKAPNSLLRGVFIKTHIDNKKGKVIPQKTLLINCRIIYIMYTKLQ